MIPLPTRAELTVPRSLAERWEVLIAAQTTGCRTRALGCALGISWGRYRRAHPYTWSPLDYGGQVIDRLLEQGYPIGAILDAGGVALALCGDGLVPVEGAEGFSAPPAVEAGGGSEP